ncbi:MAG: peptidoglycan-associated lipoprotein Pal [Pseudomonadota bacterium]|nr:peptidoglycan-associated lipoprotein Pal [Pseudomonadota bacterium]
MSLKKLGFAIAGMFLLAACETPAVEEGTSSGTGAKSGGASSTSSTSSGRAAASAIREGSPEDFVINVGDRVFFDLDKSNIRGDQRGQLEKQAAWLKKFPAARITIEGHADERGTREYNLALGDRRANSTRDFLVALGVNSGRINTVSYGKERPVALGHEEASWRQNRRAVSVVVEAGS